MTDSAQPALDCARLSVWEYDDFARDRIPILHEIDWTVRRGQHWAVLGANGAGKSTLLAVAAGMRHPSRGSARILGERLGHVDVRELRTHIGQITPWLEESFAPRRSVLDVTLSGATGSVAVLSDRLDDADIERSRGLLALVGCAHLASRPFGRCSQGERRRVMLARALLRRPALLLLDEPANGLDLPGREALLTALAALPAEEPRTSVVLVTHHLEELPVSITHALLLRNGRIVAQGPAVSVLTDALLSECFETPISVRHDDGRWAARSRPGW
jgi:iron complex transport system ATP-binding protein